MDYYRIEVVKKNILSKMREKQSKQKIKSKVIYFLYLNFLIVLIVSLSIEILLMPSEFVEIYR